MAPAGSWRAKTPSIPYDPSEAFLDGIRLALEQAGASAADLDQVLHGTTVATNMILEGKGARTALVTTRGFRHVLAIGRQDIPRKANLYTWVKPVPRCRPAASLRSTSAWPPAARCSKPSTRRASRAAAAGIRGMDVAAVAICLIHAYANPAHERRVAEILRDELPGLAITVSSDVLPVVREYERSLTTVLNAYGDAGRNNLCRAARKAPDRRGGRRAAHAHAVQRRRGRCCQDPRCAGSDRAFRSGGWRRRRSRSRAGLRHQ